MTDSIDSDIIIIRHKKENRKKCSLRHIEQKKDPHILFYTYPNDFVAKKVDIPPQGMLLHIQGNVLEQGQRGPIILLDGTWRYSEKMYKMVPELHSLCTFSLPSEWRTAYPRRQEDCVDPSRGLASIEALFIACFITGRCTRGLLDGYYWKDQFLEINKSLISTYT